MGETQDSHLREKYKIFSVAVWLDSEQQTHLVG